MHQALQRNVSSGVQALTYFLFAIIVIAFVLLSEFNNEAEFKGTLIFTTVLLGSFFALYIIAFTDVASKRLGGDNSARLFFLQDVPVSTFVIWVPIGIFGALGMALLSQNLGLSSTDSALFSIAGSGAVMMIIFFVTKTVLVPILIHGGFNTLVIALRDGIINQITINTGIPIPDVGLTVSQFNAFATDAIFQFTMVSTSEEMLKIVIIFFVILGLRGSPKEGISKYIGGVFALAIWTAYHAIQAVT